MKEVNTVQTDIQLSVCSKRQKCTFDMIAIYKRRYSAPKLVLASRRFAYAALCVGGWRLGQGKVNARKKSILLFQDNEAIFRHKSNDRGKRTELSQTEMKFSKS
jgi:hypothetical protein